MSDLPPPPPPPPAWSGAVVPVSQPPLPPVWEQPPIPPPPRQPHAVLGGVLVFVGGSLAVAGALLPWARLGSYSYSADQVAGDGTTAFGLGVVGVVVGVWLIVRRWLPLVLVAAIAGALMVAVAARNIHRVVSARDHLSDVGVGLWVTLGAGIVSLLGALAALAKRRRH
jgi:hypothetical protein